MIVSLKDENLGIEHLQSGWIGLKRFQIRLKKEKISYHHLTSVRSCVYTVIEVRISSDVVLIIIVIVYVIVFAIIL